MTVFFVIISFVFNIISIMAIIILFLRQNKLIKVEANQRKAMMEMEELMSNYLMEMKEENERFIKRIKHVNEAQLATFQVKEKAKSKAEPSIPPPKANQHEYEPRIDSAMNYQAIKAYQKQKKSQPVKKTIEEKTNVQKIEEVKGQDSIEEAFLIKERDTDASNNELLKESLLFQILIMKQQGFTVDEMAKRLNKGKSEIALLLKFQENHQE